MSVNEIIAAAVSQPGANEQGSRSNRQKVKGT